MNAFRRWNKSMRDMRNALQNTRIEFVGSNTEKLSTRIPVTLLRAVESRLESLDMTPSAYIRSLIEKDVSAL